MANSIAESQSASSWTTLERAAALQRRADRTGAIKQYYADGITADSGDQAGWIEFGRPQEHPHAQTDPAVRTYRPYEYMAVLFPSCFHHRTKPFEPDCKRISIAFDILPAA